MDLLGGSDVLHRKISNSLDVHDVILQGIPGAALEHLVDHLAILRDPVLLEKAVGISVRTLQRRKDAPAKPLNREQSGRTWAFVDVFAKAVAVLGSRDEAATWLLRPAIGLEQRRPIDLLATLAGVDLVKTYLERLEYGVYA